MNIVTETSKVTEKGIYTERQLSQMMDITRTWVLNNPTGPLPDLPKSTDSAKDNFELYVTIPEPKEPHWSIKLLMFFEII